MDTLVAQKIGKRTVVSIAGKTSSRELTYLCLCECGRESIVRGNALRNGRGNRCHGCAAAATKNRTTHGISKTPIYTSWKAMLRRCYAPKCAEFINYGGRGIGVCEEWHDPAIFYAWALTNGWAKNLSIDRMNVDLSYSPNNCRWATTAQQRENVQVVTRANKSGYRGVSLKHGRGVWLSRIMIAGKIIHLGHHSTALEAAITHDRYIFDNGLLRPTNFTPYEVEARLKAGY